MGDELERLRRCFQPRQWFQHEGEPDIFLDDGDTFMWVYRLQDKMYQVGYYAPDGTWNQDSDFDTQASAAARVNYLNGGHK